MSNLKTKPLADSIRPQSLDQFVGQKHLVGPGKPVRKIIETSNLHSLIFWGPPGCGKTTLARIIANETDYKFHYLSAVAAGKDDIRQIVNQVKQPHSPQQTISVDSSPHLRKLVLFLDEIHRFNKAQQDFLLPFVENGTITLIGATTENPSFEVISPLLSRCQIFVLNQLTNEEILTITNQAVQKLARQGSETASAGKTPGIEVKKHQVLKEADISDESLNYLVSYANGDARQALNLLENTHKLYQKINIKNLKNTLQSKHIRFDKKGDEHYNTISAFIKSMRASDPDAALYYLARMVDAGEDPLFIARRMVVFASEDIGMAQPTALVVANEVFKSCEVIGYPECAINLAHGTVYLARAKKNRSAYNAFRSAQADAEKYGNLPIPKKLRNAPTKLMKDEGYGKNYKKYTKDSLLPEKLKDKKYLE